MNGRQPGRVRSEEGSQGGHVGQVAGVERSGKLLGQFTLATAIMGQCQQQAVAAVTERRAANRPQRVLNPFGQGEAFAAEDDMGVLKARPGEPKLVKEVVERLTGDRYAEAAHVAKV